MDVGNVAFTECVKDIAYALRLFSFGPWCHTCWNKRNNISHMWYCVRPRSQQLLYTSVMTIHVWVVIGSCTLIVYILQQRKRCTHKLLHESWFLTCKTNPTYGLLQIVESRFISLKSIHSTLKSVIYVVNFSSCSSKRSLNNISIWTSWGWYPPPQQSCTVAKFIMKISSHFEKIMMQGQPFGKNKKNPF
jgi:hypothetical protein